jgi:predicted AlkP superfamily pyrophosphatase or phosphodiesterase
MLNSASIRTVNHAKFSHRFVKPCYGSYCFSSLPAFIDFLLTGQGQNVLPLDVLSNLPTRYDKVVFFFIDAFGWKFFERFANKSAFLKRVLNEGVVSKLTSQFPSTTAAHVTCIHTGLDVGQSGIYEWQYYEPLVDDIISPLLFSFARDKLTRETLKQAGIPATLFFPQPTLFRTLQERGVVSHVFQYHTYAASTYSSIVFRGANVHPYNTLQESFAQLRQLLLQENHAPAYYFLYFDRIDAISHQYGPYSKQCEAAIDNLLTLLSESFAKALHGKTGKTLFIMTADHGQVEVDPRTTFYLNKEFCGIERWFKTGAKGCPLVPAGSARDMFLHIKEDCVDRVITLLQQRLDGKAEVYRTQELLAQRFFGQHEPLPALLNRLGNVVILPYANETVWWYEEGKFSMHFRGHHGGLTPEEMEIPLLVLPL